MDNIAKLLAIIALASFGIDRINAGASYLLNAERLGKLEGRLAERLRDRGRRKVLLLALSAAICAALVSFSDIRLAGSISPSLVREPVDVLLTWVLLFAGADRLKDILQGIKGGTAAPKRIEPAVVVKVDNDEPLKLKAV